MQYQIGQKLFFATTKTIQREVPCPVCCGKKFVIVIYGDDSAHTLDCECCKRPGYLGDDFSAGFITVYEHGECIEEITITSASISEGVTYGAIDHYRIMEKDLFLTKEGAAQRCEELKNERNKEEEQRYKTKQNARYSWAWNASYHKKCIERAHKDIAYHTKKLEVADRLKQVKGV